MGMRTAEIRRKFDDIVDFAEVEEFVDTPVKRYSSGMYVRPRVRVAAFLEPEILLIDEVLAVGDAKFQRKCIAARWGALPRGTDRPRRQPQHGVVSQLCPRTLWLSDGRIRDLGGTAEIVRAYLRESDAGGRGDEITLREDPLKDSQLVAARLLTDDGDYAQRFSCDQGVLIELDYLVRRPATRLYGCLEVHAGDGTPVLVSYSYDNDPNTLEDLPAGLHTFRLRVPPRSLGAGDYRLHFSVARGMKGTVEMDNPGFIARFTLDDVTTLKGNRRLGYLSTLIDWDVTQQGAHTSEVS